MENLMGNIQEVARHATQGLTMADESNREAEKGNELMSQVVTGMNSIEQNTGQISEFVSLISDISDQVNLLALNASIEAARAGEHGRGFAVVADEISKLADETSSAAKSINELVSQGQVEVNRGRQSVDSVSLSLGTIIKNVQATAKLVGEIARSAQNQHEAGDGVLAQTGKIRDMSDSISRATSEQSIANREIYLSIERINEAAQSIADGSVNVARSSVEINRQSNELKELISFFRFNDE